jgi:hypothetical protein
MLKFFFEHQLTNNCTSNMKHKKHVQVKLSVPRVPTCPGLDKQAMVADMESASVLQNRATSKH